MIALVLCLVIAYPKVDDNSSLHYETRPVPSCSELDARFHLLLSRLLECLEKEGDCERIERDLDDINKARSRCYEEEN